MLAGALGWLERLCALGSGALARFGLGAGVGDGAVGGASSNVSGASFSLGGGRGMPALWAVGVVEPRVETLGE